MGYNTRFELTTIHRDFEDNYLEVAAEEISDEFRYIDSGESMKWYDHDKHMLDLSRRFPDEVFILTGVGEEDGDIWRSVYKNGNSKSQNAVITFPEMTLDGVRVKEATL